MQSMQQSVQRNAAIAFGHTPPQKPQELLRKHCMYVAIWLTHIAVCTLEQEQRTAANVLKFRQESRLDDPMQLLKVWLADDTERDMIAPKQAPVGSARS